MGRFEKDFANYTMTSSPEIPENFFYVDQKEKDIWSNPIFEQLNELLIIPLNTPTKESTNKDNKLVIKKPSSKVKKSATQVKGSESFEKAFAEAAKIDPTVAERKDFFVRTAKRESGFNSGIQNGLGAPCYGYFLIHADNIKNLTNLSVEQFRKDPVALILTANKLYNQNLLWMKSNGVYNLGIKKGYSELALMSGCWLGPNATKTYLLGKGNPSDKHWSKDGKTGISVGDLMNGWMKGIY